MKQKPVILTFIRHYIPGYLSGGPVRTLANMVDHLGDKLDFRIVTLDRDVSMNKPYRNIVHGEWNKVGNAQVLYLSHQDASTHRLVEVFNKTEPKVIYLNSFFDNTFTQRILWARQLGRLDKTPIVLAPRGELSTGALALKQMKKKLYLCLVKSIGLYRDLVWHASSVYEQSDVLRVLNYSKREDVARVVVARDLALKSNEFSIQRTPRLVGEPLRVCFLSRISPMKNLDFALKVLEKVRGPVLLTIYGPKENASYWDKCSGLIAALPPNIMVVNYGEIHPTQVKKSLSQHDLFFLPTRGENYGHVILEALVAGLPVLISDQTQWNSVREREVGWAFPLNANEPFCEVIESLIGWTTKQHEEMGIRATAYAKEIANDSIVLEQNQSIFSNLIAGMSA